MSAKQILAVPQGSLGIDATSLVSALFVGCEVISKVIADATPSSTLEYNYNSVDVSAPDTFMLMGCAIGLVGFSPRKSLALLKS